MVVYVLIPHKEYMYMYMYTVHHPSLINRLKTTVNSPLTNTLVSGQLYLQTPPVKLCILTFPQAGTLL